jgi:formylglycine-generating enzyme required for sulfatase activity
MGNVSNSSTGSNDAKSVQQYCIDQPFWIDRTEVTNASYGSVSNPACDGDADSTTPVIPRDCVNWHEALAFCQVHGERLPTEAEWEWAARGPNNLLYPWGNQFDAAKAIVVHNVNYPNHAAPVGSDPSGASWVGALDMSGNLWDWTSSIYDPARFAYPYPATDGRDNLDDLTSERVLRGGSWNDSGDEATTTYRHHARPDVQTETIGFRCVRDFAH